MFFRSIRWRLQLWHGLLLLTVLAGFGFTAHRLQRANELRRVDEELNQRVNVLAGTLERRGPPGRRGPDGAGPPPSGERGERRGPPRRPERNAAPETPEPPPAGEPTATVSGEPSVTGPGRRDPGEYPPPPPGFRLRAEHELLFGGAESNAFYYAVWRRDGQELARSKNAPPDTALPERAGSTASVHGTRARGLVREAYHFTPPGECLLVGRSIAPELAGLHRFALWLTGLGGAVLVLGLAGGWWLATRAIRPIDDISAAAAKIATGDLSQRISATDTDNELGRLAGVLNSAFARLEAAFTQQAQFTSDASHELRTPVSVILTQTQTALARERPAADYRETLEACQRAAQRMRRLIESLLELARLDAGQEKMKRAPFDLAGIARECVELVRPLAAERRITVETDLPEVVCSGDAERLAQVITNLLANAIHHNQDGGQVRLTVRRENGTATLSIADTGPGIPAADLPRISDRFYRVDQSRTGATGGTGLGLAIAKAIVEAHGGAIEVASEPGAGATFTVRLPAEAAVVVGQASRLPAAVVERASRLPRGVPPQ